LEARGLTLVSAAGDEAAQAPVHDVSFSLCKGEIVGIYGLLGAGRTELVEALAGNRELDRGEIFVRGKSVRICSVADAVRAGIVLVPEDRQRDGLIPDLSIRENIALAATSGPVVTRQKELQRVRALVHDLRIAARDLELPVVALSGGNQQKVLLSRLLETEPKVLILDEPTRGVDIGAKSEIYRIIDDLARRGVAVLVISSDLPEVVGICDRVVVMREGHMQGEVGGDSGVPITEETIMALATGVELSEAA